MAKVEMEVVFRNMEVDKEVSEASGPACSEGGSERAPEPPRKRKVSLPSLKEVIPPILVFLIALGIWETISRTVAPMLPGPIQTFAKSWDLIRDPFFDHGPN
ncbi:MAG TPA: hypothetical protein VFA47_14145, partial [Candidatus Manganitrophaceae bacterium]|nr:hypothetical protein [Candidatus Manganitrophaceae bacterium]